MDWYDILGLWGSWSVCWFFILFLRVGLRVIVLCLWWVWSTSPLAWFFLQPVCTDRLVIHSDSSNSYSHAILCQFNSNFFERQRWVTSAIDVWWFISACWFPSTVILFYRCLSHIWCVHRCVGIAIDLVCGAVRLALFWAIVVLFSAMRSGL